MDYKESENTKSLQAIIGQLKVSQKVWPKKAEDADKIWNASLLFSNIILGAKVGKHLFTRKDFQNFKKSYEQKNSKVIDDDSLFERFWLREVLGFIHIPDAVRIVTLDYEKYCNNHIEVLFLKMLYQSYPRRKISEKNNKELSVFERKGD